jgi:hypothetical protein
MEEAITRFMDGFKGNQNFHFEMELHRGASSCTQPAHYAHYAHFLKNSRPPKIQLQRFDPERRGM